MVRPVESPFPIELVARTSLAQSSSPLASAAPLVLGRSTTVNAWCDETLLDRSVTWTSLRTERTMLTQLFHRSCETLTQSVH